MNISEKLKLWRVKKSMTQEDAARYFGVVLKTYHNWETGKTKAPEYLTKIIEQ